VDRSQLEKFHPLMMHNILSATRRFEPDFYAHLCRAYHLDADRILGLFTEIEAIGPGQLSMVLKDLRQHQAYHDIMYLSGRNSLHMWLEHKNLQLDPKASGRNRYASLLKELLVDFLGSATAVQMVRGSLLYLELNNSVFARNVHHDKPVCGFYSGFAAELGANLVPGACTATEVRCCAVEPDAPTCLFQISL